MSTELLTTVPDRGAQYLQWFLWEKQVRFYGMKCLKMKRSKKKKKIILLNIQITHNEVLVNLLRWRREGEKEWTRKMIEWAIILFKNYGSRCSIGVVLCSLWRRVQKKARSRPLQKDYTIQIEPNLMYVIDSIGFSTWLSSAFLNLKDISKNYSLHHNN